MPPLAFDSSFPAHGFSTQLQVVLRLLNAGLGVRYFRVQLGGFDTHAGQENTLNRMLESVSGGLVALRDALGPEEWARTALALYREHHADCIVAEANNGGEMVAATLRVHDRGANVRTVHATRGKATRAEPVAALYEQARVSHVGALARLEDQLTTWDPATSRTSPDRLDALVWALTEVMLTDAPARLVTEDHYDF